MNELTRPGGKWHLKNQFLELESLIMGVKLPLIILMMHPSRLIVQTLCSCEEVCSCRRCVAIGGM